MKVFRLIHKSVKLDWYESNEQGDKSPHWRITMKYKYRNGVCEPLVLPIEIREWADSQASANEYLSKVKDELTMQEFVELLTTKHFDNTPDDYDYEADEKIFHHREGEDE